MKLEDIKKATELLKEYTRLSELIARVHKGDQLEVFVGGDGDEIGYVDGLYNAITDVLIHARIKTAHILKYSYNFPVEDENQPELPCVKKESPLTTTIYTGITPKREFVVPFTGAADNDIPEPLGPADQSWRLQSTPIMHQPRNPPCVCHPGKSECAGECNNSGGQR